MPFCFIRGGLNAAADACNDDAHCAAFVTGSRFGVHGAYLKSAIGPPTSNTDTSLYLKRTGGPCSTSTHAWHVTGQVCC
jgi:hypothetical protein